MSGRAILPSLVAVTLLTGCGGAESPPDPRMALGRQVFIETASPNCGTCHVLAEAGAAGAIGPNLDQLRPTQERVAAAVTGGVGIMPAFSGSLSADEIQAVAYYVSRVTGGATDSMAPPAG